MRDRVAKMVEQVVAETLEQIAEGEEPYIAAENAIGGVMDEFDDDFDEFSRAVAEKVNAADWA